LEIDDKDIQPSAVQQAVGGWRHIAQIR